MTKTSLKTIEESVQHNNFSVYPGYSMVKQELINIFKEEIESDDSIFIFINENVIDKIMIFLIRSLDRPISLGIAGETASGKSTIAFDIMNTIEKFAQKNNFSNIISCVNSDDYYYDRSKEVEQAGGFENFAKNYDFDVPEALELDLMSFHISELLKGKGVYLPKYDMSGSAKRFDNFLFVKPTKIIISEGLFTLNKALKDVFDFKIYVHVDKEIQKERFFKRANERNLGQSSKRIYENASKKAKVHIYPTRHYADIILSGESDRKRYCNFVEKILDVVENLQCGFSCNRI